MSIEVIIADSGPLIALARIKHLELLPTIFGRVVVPGAVFRELTEGAAEGRTGAEAVRNAGWIDVQHADPELTAAFSLIVDAGESEAIALAVRAPSSLLIMDDRRGRRLALDRGLRVKGTVGLLVLAKQRGLVPAVRPLLAALEFVGIFVTPQLLASALVEAGEHDG